jgi:hypothetical protein
MVLGSMLMVIDLDFSRFGWRLLTAGYANERHEFKASYIDSFKINWPRHEITQPIDRQ